MNNRVKRAMKDVEGLGFVRDYDSKMAGIVYRHGNAPEDFIKFQEAMSDSGVTFVLNKARKIAGAGSSGARPQTLKERATITRRKQKTQRERDEEARRARAEQAEAEYEKRQAEKAAERERRAISDLMRPGYGR